jgi:hypothetical protein
MMHRFFHFSRDAGCLIQTDTAYMNWATFRFSQPYKNRLIAGGVYVRYLRSGSGIHRLGHPLLETDGQPVRRSSGIGRKAWIQVVEVFVMLSFSTASSALP